MAKKALKKVAKKASAKTSKKPTPKGGKANGRTKPVAKAKGGAKKGGGKKAGGSRAMASGPTPVAFGKGASPIEIGRDLVAMFNAGTPDHEIWAKHFHRDLESVEGGPEPMLFRGLEAAQGKGEWWYANFTVHGAAAEGPYVGPSGFAVKYRMDVEEKATGKREWKEEVGFYTVRDGKVVREEFLYAM